MAYKSKNIEGILRRNVIDEMNQAEQLIHHTMTEVEELGADEKLTNAQIKLQEAKDLISDFVDISNCDHDYECTTDTDTWSSYKCKNCPSAYIQDFE